MKYIKKIISNDFLQIFALFITIFGGIAGGLAFIGVHSYICFAIFVIPNLYILILHSVEKKRANALPTAVTPGNHDALETILSKRIIRAGCVHYPPLLDFDKNDFDKNGKVSGLYADMLSLIASRNNFKLTYVPLKWGQLQSAINKNDVDFILCIFPTEARNQYSDFAAIMHRIDVGGVVLKGNTKVVDHEDLQKSDVEIAVTRGEIGWEYADRFLKLRDDLGRFIVMDGFDIKKMMGLVKSGTVDIAIADALSCYHYCNTDTGNSTVNIFSTSPLYVCDNGIMIGKGQDNLRDWLNNQFSLVRDETKIKRKERAILQSYHGVIKRVEIQ